jgi:hypothetical protein
LEVEELEKIEAAQTSRSGRVDLMLNVVLSVTGTMGGKAAGRVHTLENVVFSYLDEGMKNAGMADGEPYRGYWSIERYEWR